MLSAPAQTQHCKFFSVNNNQSEPGFLCRVGSSSQSLKNNFANGGLIDLNADAAQGTGRHEEWLPSPTHLVLHLMLLMGPHGPQASSSQDMAGLERAGHSEPDPMSEMQTGRCA